MSVPKYCCVCGKLLKRGCKCPWGKPFSAWPQALLDTLRAITHGGGEAR